MSIKRGKEYIESLKEVKPRVYSMGEKIESVVERPMFAPHVNTAAMTHELANHPEFEEIMTATSHLTAEKINRFTHIHQNINDLAKNVRMMRLLG